MKRDMELIRLILLAVEGEEAVELNDYDEEQLSYQRWLLLDAGLALGSDISRYAGNHPAATITFLNWRGHEFIDAARSETIWNKTMATVKKNVSSVSFDLLMVLLVAYAKKQLDIH